MSLHVFLQKLQHALSTILATMHWRRCCMLGTTDLPHPLAGSTGKVTMRALASALRLRNPGAASSKPPSTR